MRRRSGRKRRGRRNWLVAGAVLGLVLVAAWFFSDVFAAPPDVVARVLFSETASCSSYERLRVAGVMRNRIGNRAFGGLPTLRAVVEQPGAFSCIGDEGNTNWQKTRHPGRMTAAERRIWAECVAIAEGRIEAALGESGRPLVYYHDKSIGKPGSWDNAAWRAVREETTAHFVFYSIVPAGRARE